MINFLNHLLKIFSFLEESHKKNLSENPLIETADVTEVGPGIGVIFILLFIHSFTKITPGSEILGEPASEIKDILIHLLKIELPWINFFH